MIAREGKCSIIPSKPGSRAAWNRTVGGGGSGEDRGAGKAAG